MCVRVTCPRCRKPTYSGCGAHVESVLRDVPKDQRCKCREQPPAERDPADRAKPKRWFWF
jgi:hypothetical protein